MRNPASERIYQFATEIERQPDFVRRGVAVIVELDLVEGWFGLTPDGPSSGEGAVEAGEAHCDRICPAS